MKYFRFNCSANFFNIWLFKLPVVDPDEDSINSEITMKICCFRINSPIRFSPRFESSFRKRCSQYELFMKLPAHRPLMAENSKLFDYLSDFCEMEWLAHQRFNYSELWMATLLNKLSGKFVPDISDAISAIKLFENALSNDVLSRRKRFLLAKSFNIQLQEL